MSTLSPLGARTLPASAYAAGTTPADSKTRQSAVTRQAGSVTDNPISLSSSGIDLQKRVDAVSSRTVDYAQNLLGSFAQQLFGDAGNGATISFDSASLDVSSSYAVGVQHSEGAGSITDATALQLNDSSHFLGKGTITTTDGRKFDFEVEIQYSYELQASASQTQSSGASAAALPSSAASYTNIPAASAANDTAATGNSSQAGTTAQLPAVVFPNIDFAGTLGDLFKLIGHDLHGTLTSGGGDNSQGSAIDRNTLRSLSLRLLSLTDHKSNDTYTDSKAKSAANAYAATADSGADNGITSPPPTPATNEGDDSSDSAAA
ncbi:MAG: hypothetical protein ACEQSK_06310 [Sphingomonadaceae bacterium]